MTEEQATRRRCAECGRFLSGDATDGVCTSCGATNETAADQPGAESTNGTMKVPAQEPITPVRPARSASSSLSAGRGRPPRGVVILRPSELHPDAPSPIRREPPEQPPVEREEPPPLIVERKVPPPLIVERNAPSPTIEIQPRVMPVVEQKPRPHARQRTAPIGWVLRIVGIVVGITIGILVGVAIPFLMSR